MNKDIDEIKCIVCNKSIKRGAPGTCMHETGFDHHLKCTFTPEMEQAIQDLITKARIQELEKLKPVKGLGMEDNYDLITDLIDERLNQLKQSEE